MGAFELYKIYLAIKLHFTVDQYDVFKTNGAVKGVTEQSFNQKGLRYRFLTLSKQFSSTRESVEYFVSCFAYGVDVFDNNSADEAYSTWKKRKEMMTQCILDDLDEIDSSWFIGSPCKLQQMLQGKKINIETGVALNRVLNFADDWIKNDLIYGKLGSKIKKLDKFIKYNEDKVKQVIESYEQQETTFV